MILVVSQSGDPSTQHIIDWLSYYKANFVHISDRESCVCFKSMNISNLGIDTHFVVEGKEVNISDIEAYFWRRGFFHYSFSNIKTNIARSGDLYFDEQVSRHLQGEKDKLLKSIYLQLENVDNKIGSYTYYDENKLDVLLLAKKNDLDIPRTLVTTQKKELLRFLKECGRIISKPINRAFTHKANANLSYSHLTVSISNDDIQEQAEEFFPTLFQEALSKVFELRIFYLKGQCYSMAIFSQNDEQTKVDFRNYNEEKPNRTVPFLLPKEISNKISLLMDLLNLDNGSVDMIYTTDKRYVFLEVNPVGQFGMVSYPCNYYLEKRIAKQLIQKKI